MAALPPNVHVSTHPCLHAKLSQLRSHATSSRDTNALVAEIATILGVEALGSNLSIAEDGTVRFFSFRLNKYELCKN